MQTVKVTSGNTGRTLFKFDWNGIGPLAFSPMMESIRIDFSGHWLREQQKFCRECVPNATYASSLIHLKKELVELEEEINYGVDDEARDYWKEKILKEYADVILCTASSALQFGFTPEEIMNAIEAKIHENLYVRTWKENADGTYSHVK